MDEPVDVYSDQFQINTGAFGCTLNFNATKSIPPAPGSPPEFNRMATVRMSMEHLKMLTYIIRRQVIKQETDTGISYVVPREVLNALHVSPEDWDNFWRQV